MVLTNVEVDTIVQIANPPSAHASSTRQFHGVSSRNNRDSKLEIPGIRPKTKSTARRRQSLRQHTNSKLETGCTRWATTSTAHLSTRYGHDDMTSRTQISW